MRSWRVAKNPLKSTQADSVVTSIRLMSRMSLALLIAVMSIAAAGCAERRDTPDPTAGSTATVDAPEYLPDSPPTKIVPPEPTPLSQHGAAEPYVRALASHRPAEYLALGRRAVVPGSTADQYLAIQTIEELTYRFDNFAWQDAETLKPNADGESWLMCNDGGCDKFGGFEGIDGAVTRLSLDGNSLVGRFTGPSRKVRVPTFGTAQVVATYRSPLTDTLRVYVKATSQREAVYLADDLAVYRNPSTRHRDHWVNSSEGAYDPYDSGFTKFEFPSAPVGGVMSFSFCTDYDLCLQVDLPTEPIGDPPTTRSFR